jgi:predicted metalloprotease with PDZ domain
MVSYSRKFLITALFITSMPALRAANSDSLKVEISIDTQAQRFLVTLRTQTSGDSTAIVFASWTPGYYQLMNYSGNVSDFQATNLRNESLTVVRKRADTWTVLSKGESLIIKYYVAAKRNFVATSFIGQSHTYIMPAALVPMIDGNTSKPISLSINYSKAAEFATSLQRTNSSKLQFKAKDYDELYDSPVLIGALERLESFKVKDRWHHFSGIMLKEFDRQTFMRDLSKIVQCASDVIGKIPYKEYHFIGIGPGQGGIEHLSSTAVAFDGSELQTREGKLQVYNFLAHEYFHHYNVKRIRPVELGPFDYTKENRTNMLWIAEGITVYYDHLIVARAGLYSGVELLKKFSDLINHYESDRGKNHQTLAEASFNTWNDGPFGNNSSGSVDNTISVYEKGTVVALLLDMRIRKETNGRKSLDNVMRVLYEAFYERKGRGFTEKEFQSVCERIAGAPLSDVFEYVYTLKPIDYQQSFADTGLRLTSSIDTTRANRYELTFGKEQRRSSILRNWID